MITCKECIQRLYPDDPRQPSYLKGRYLSPICNDCDKPLYYRELETKQPPEQVMVHRQSNMSKLESDLLQQTARKANYLLKKVLEKKGSLKKYNTYT